MALAFQSAGWRRGFQLSTLAGLLLASWAGAYGQLASTPLSIHQPPDDPGWIRLSSSAVSNTVLTLRASTNLAQWSDIATLHDALYEYPDAETRAWVRRFYRTQRRTRGPDDDWKNQILYPIDAFRSTNSSTDVRWVKFAIALAEPARVYYQHSGKYVLHYDFVTQRLAPFIGIDYPTFESVALHRTNQQLVLGSVLYQPSAGAFPPGTVFSEFGVQFDGLDPYPADEIARWFNLVRATVYSTNGAEALYMPSFEQSEMARTNAQAFEALGIPVASIDRWVTVNTCYSPGWALGQLKYFSATEVEAAFADGRLRPEDILLTDGVPADMPIVAGIISLTASTLNSHTAILAQSFGVPFVYLSNAGDQAWALSLAGKQVILRATVDRGAPAVLLLDVDGLLDPELEADLLALKAPEPIEFMPQQWYGAFSTGAENLVPTDIRYFGGKAANYGFLRRCVPTNCPIAIAFSFDVWEDFLDQVMSDGRTLREQIAMRLAWYTTYPPDMPALKWDLAAVRQLITDEATFTVEQRVAILSALQERFNPARKLRFRSSTNVEDAEHFTGAGLYDSCSGCLADDLDGDSAGPCRCDPAEANERGVFSALQKVYASFYNDDAFLERLRHGVDETQVAMGVLVHHSFPDEEELANGVATPQFTFGPTSTNLSGPMVTQLGAESVTNPDGSSVPEVVNVSRSNASGATNTSFLLKQCSSRVPLGAYVMNWQDDYRRFIELFAAVGQGFKNFYPAKNGFTLDFEYKKDATLGLVVKQVREVPQPAGTNLITPYLMDDPRPMVVRQGFGNECAIHRLKSIWQLHTTNLYLGPTNLAQGIYTQGTLQYVADGTTQLLSGPLSSWPNASNSPSGSINYWTTGSGAAQRNWQLQTTVKTNMSESATPIVTQHDFNRRLTVTYATPVPTINGTVSNESVDLELAKDGADPGSFQQRLFQTNGVSVQTSYYWQQTPWGMVTLDTPLLRFTETTITGLTTTPVVLTNYYSQTYSSFNHNYYEFFIFEPRLEPGLPAATLAELNAANIQFLYLRSSGTRLIDFYILGLDNVFRKL